MKKCDVEIGFINVLSWLICTYKYKMIENSTINNFYNLDEMYGQDNCR